MRFYPALFAGLVLACALTSHAADVRVPQSDPQLQDIERYLLLYSATGDDRFLQRLERLGVTFEQKLGEQKHAAPLMDMWQLYRQTLGQVHAAYYEKGVDLKEALRQSREVADLFDSFLVQQPQTTAPAQGELRELALLQARRANRHLLGEPASSDTSRIGHLQDLVQQRLEALPSSDERDRLLVHWNYLLKASTADGTLLYPFNAQIEYLSSHLPQS